MRSQLLDLAELAPDGKYVLVIREPMSDDEIKEFVVRFNEVVNGDLKIAVITGDVEVVPASQVADVGTGRQEYYTELWQELTKEIDYPVLDRDRPLELFGEPSMVHDWRNYIPDAFADRWEQLSAETRLALYVVGKIQASKESWD